jgi:hypothetical protein
MTPISADSWPCFEMRSPWAHRRVNQHLKRDRLPSAMALRQARDCMLDWWRAAYLALPHRFAEEARAGLPAIEASGSVLDLDEVFAAVGLQRLRLHQDQQVPEWTR